MKGVRSRRTTHVGSRATRRRLHCWTMCVIVLTALASQSGCDKPVDSPVRAELSASIDQITPGVPFTLGVFLSLQPGWHVYWKFPGDAGLPPTITWQLPEGWVIGEIEWPLPQRYTETGPLTTYGYSDSVMLLVSVTPPADAAPVSAIMLHARINWLVCHEECIPGKADVELQLPMAAYISENSSGDLASSARLERWRKMIPRQAEEVGIRAITAVDIADSTEKKAAVRLDISTAGTDVVVVDWFPAPTSDCAVTNISRSEGTAGSVVSFELHSYTRPISDIGVLESLLVCEDTSGKRFGFVLLTTINPE